MYVQKKIKVFQLKNGDTSALRPEHLNRAAPNPADRAAVKGCTALFTAAHVTTARKHHSHWAVNANNTQTSQTVIALLG